MIEDGVTIRSQFQLSWSTLRVCCKLLDKLFLRSQMIYLRCVTVLLYNVLHKHIAIFILDTASETKNILMVRFHTKQDEHSCRMHATVLRHASTSLKLTSETSLLNRGESFDKHFAGGNYKERTTICISSFAVLARIHWLCQVLRAFTRCKKTLCDLKNAVVMKDHQFKVEISTFTEISASLVLFSPCFSRYKIFKPKRLPFSVKYTFRNECEVYKFSHSPHGFLFDVKKAGQSISIESPSSSSSCCILFAFVVQFRTTPSCTRSLCT